MSIPIFLSYPRPHMIEQEAFIEALKGYLRDQGLEPRTLGVTDYDMDTPLKAVRRLMLESNGVITIAFKRLHIEQGVNKYASNIAGNQPSLIQDQWITSPWCHIEPAMAFQLGLPILVFREQGVLEEGILERGVVGLYMPEFSLTEGPEHYLKQPQWRQLLSKWEGYIRAVVDAKGQPPRLY